MSTELSEYKLKEGIQKNLCKVIAKDKGRRFYENMKKADIKI